MISITLTHKIIQVFEESLFVSYLKMSCQFLYFKQGLTQTKIVTEAISKKTLHYIGSLLWVLLEINSKFLATKEPRFACLIRSYGLASGYKVNLEELT